VFDALKKYQGARQQYELAMVNLEGENEKNEVRELLDNLSY
jgi:hypothetical protein